MAVKKKLQKLTDRDLGMIGRVTDEWIAIGTATGPANRPKVEQLVNQLYDVNKQKPPPKFTWFLDPCEAVKYVTAKTNTKVNTVINNASYGQHDSYWLSFWSFFKQSESVTLENDEPVAILAELAKEIGWWWPYDVECIISERPAEIHLDAAKRLHAEDGMALKYSDNWGVYSWHGYRIPTNYHWIIREKHKLNPDVIEKEGNAEIRRIMLEIFGFAKYLQQRKAKLISEDVDGAGNPRKLYEIDVAGEAVRIIELNNSSIEPDGSRRKFHLGAMPGETPHEAVAASFGFNPKAFKEETCT
jgi:hypothetical protein